MRRYLFIFPVFLLLLLLVLWGAGQVSYHRGLESLARQSGNQLDLYIAYLQGVLEKYEGLPELLATNRQLVSLLQNPGSRERIDALNRYLETINNISDASDTYLMDREGLTIAASNWNKPKPFVGRNFSYRPYFRQAMEGRLGRYFALGTASSARGYYFAYPVIQEKTILGAVVIKIDIDAVEENWGRQDDIFYVTDPDGVIFITNREDWRFRTLKPLPAEIRERLASSRRYPDARLEPLGVLEEKPVKQGAIVSLRLTPDGPAETFLQQMTVMEQADWKVFILTRLTDVQRDVVYTVSELFVASALAVTLGLLLWQRRLRLTERQRFAEEHRRVLEETNEMLESRVTERTAALTEINRKMRGEIQERKRAEEELHKTRGELVHAAKLAALGQMSAGVTHELNQPLAAIRSYTDNACKLLANNRSDDVLWNLAQINELTDRMASLSLQLKTFARKSSGKISAVPLHGVIDGALEMLAPVISRAGTAVEIQLEPDVVAVRANNVLLQQVLVNLLANALQAMEGQETKRVEISARLQGDLTVLRVIDSGPGIRSLHMEQVFEPFFTTKESGKGLGLGLTISARIIEEMGGSIRVADSGPGACFEMTLHTATTYSREDDATVDQGSVYR
ncbi:MAG: sensor histidine kinase [Desulfobulbus propionicus]|nr:MAG: sensor histidine kinase [Desulfobulbus propionicus]